MAAPSLIVAGLNSEREMPVFATIAKRRGVLRIAGEDRVSFLQGLVTNDVARAAAGQPVYSALLTAQGRFLHDFFIVPQADSLLLDCEAERRADLMRRLGMYKLRSKVTIEDKTDSFAVILLWGDGLETGALQPQRRRSDLCRSAPPCPGSPRDRRRRRRGKLDRQARSRRGR